MPGGMALLLQVVCRLYTHFEILMSPMFCLLLGGGKAGWSSCAAVLLGPHFCSKQKHAYLFSEAICTD
jgi:hypothetical protein